jgi:hypothetical protein
MEEAESEGTTSRGRFKPGRRPHNAVIPTDGSLKDVVHRIANELHEVTINTKRQTITRKERVFRLTVDRASKGNVRDIVHILSIMAKHPELAASFRVETVYFFNGALANA